MQTFPPLATLGRRIAIMGPSNAGKSTLGAAIGRAIGVEPIHLDQFRHYPNTDWQMRPDAEFHALHDAAIERDGWTMDGNYSVLMPQRFARATGAIVLSSNRWLRLGRYLRRTLFQKNRAGSLEGAQDSLKWDMVQWVFNRSTGHADRYRGMVLKTDLPHVFCHGAGELEALYRQWGLTR
jgi:adenylate kinase family enzyme